MSNRSGRIVWIAAALTLLLQLYMTGFFTQGERIPLTVDVNPGRYKDGAFSWPPQSSFNTQYFLGFSSFPAPFHPVSLAAHLSVWLFFTLYFPLFATLGLLGCYALLRELDFSPVVSTLGGLAFAWQGDLFSSIFPGHFPAVTIWAAFPFALLFAIRSCRQQSWFLAACSGAFTGLMVLLLPDRGGICSLLVGVYFLREIFRHWTTNTPLAVETMARFVLTVVVAGLVALPGLVPIFQFNVKDVDRSTESLQEKFNWATQWSFAPEDLITYPFPGFLGWFQDDDAGPYWGRIGQSAGWPEKHEGMRNFCQVTFSTGTVAFLLALFGLIRLVRERDVINPFTDEQRSVGRFFAVVTGIGLILALGKYTPIYSYAFKLPLMSTWRNPLKFLMPVNLLLVMLAAYGAQAFFVLLSDPSEIAAAIKSKISKRLGRLVLLLGTGWLFSYVLIIPMALWLARLNYTPEQRGAIFSNLNLSLLVAACCVAMLWLAWKILSRPEQYRGRLFINPLIQKLYDAVFKQSNLGATWLIVCMAGIALQMAWVQSHYIRLYPYKSLYASSPLIDRLRPSHGESPFRVKIDMSDSLLYESLSTVFPYFGISSIDIDAVSRMPSDYAAFFSTLQKESVRILQLGGVRYWVMPAKEVETAKADPILSKNIAGVSWFVMAPTGQANEPTHGLVEMRDYLPKALLVPGLEVLPTRAAVLERLADPAWNPRQEILAAQDDLPNGVDAHAAANKKGPLQPLPAAKITHYDGHTIEVEADAPQPAYLLINDRFDPGVADWTVWVNGAPSKIFRADYILRGLALPAGHSKVVMHFEPLLYGEIPPAWPIYIEMGVLFLIALIGLWRGMSSGDGAAAGT